MLSWGLFLHGIPLFAITAGLFRPTHPRTSAGLFAMSALLAFCAWEGFFRGPHHLEVTRYVIETAKLEEPLRIVVVADLQADEIGDYEERALRTAMEQQPDLLVLPGDYVQSDVDSYDGLMGELRTLLQAVNFSAPHGLVAVEGNVDRPSWPNLFSGPRAHCFTKTGHVDLEQLRVTGLSFADSFHRRLTIPATDRFHLVVGHGPDFSLGNVEADLLIAGHTHGGQVRVPGFGPLLTLSRVPRSWAAGRTELPGGRTLLVSRGIGMERGKAPRVRFFCRPEVLVVDLVPSPK